jgi:hypothetical protein
MIEIRYNSPHDLDISGSPDDLQLVQQRIFDLLKSGALQVIVKADGTIDPSPYAFAIPGLVLVKGQCPTRISLKDAEQLQIEGSPENLEKFASFFDFEASASKGDHLHYEYFKGIESIAEDFIPLVVSVR